LREAYRLNNHSLHQALLQKQKQVAVFILYTGKEMPTFQSLQKTVQAALEKLQKVVD
jgi:ribonuclease P protein component